MIPDPKLIASADDKSIYEADVLMKDGGRLCLYAGERAAAVRNASALSAHSGIPLEDRSDVRERIDRQLRDDHRV
jgi:hypothetical protein